MKLDAIYHRTTDNYCYQLNDEELNINIKTGKDIDKVSIIYGDPFDGGILGGDWSWSGKEEEIIHIKELPYHVWWTITVKPRYKRCKYYFKLTAGNEVYFYFEDGFYTKEELKDKGKSLECFVFPWMNSSDLNKTPAWVNDTVWYQIFPERFCNGDTSNDPPDTLPWEYHAVTSKEFYGGDLQGILNRLDYISDLGINGIYLTPIFESDSNHKYDTTDYGKIDPRFGDETGTQGVS